MKDPKTPSEWQEAVDAAKFFLELESCRAYGLISGGPEVNTIRCEKILKRGAELGFFAKNPAALVKKYLGGIS